MTANFIHGKQEEKLWTTGAKGEGVFLKRSRGSYITCPETLKYDGSLIYDSIHKLNVQVIPDIEALPFCQKHQCAAFVLSEKMLVVWEDQPHSLIKRATDIDDALFNMICMEPPINDKRDRADPRNTFHNWQGMHNETDKDEKRPTMIYQPCFTALTLILAIGVVGLGWRHIAIEITVDGGYSRLLFLIAVVPQLWLGLFFFQALVGNCAQILGCVQAMEQNTKIYSGRAPYRLCSNNLPHVTIQMPVYKENLATVIAPTIRSLKRAISTYEMQGGSANIFINDDGMQVISEEDAKARQDYYDSNNIGWVARPPHNPDGKIENKPKYFRHGKFKKASNMNFGLRVSMDLEQLLADPYYEFLRSNDDWDQQQENEIYVQEMGNLIDKHGAWADGNIRIGDYILLVDSDTRIPADCLLEAVSELEKCKNLAILQFSSGVMNVTDNFFEKGITFFTNLIYTQIKFAVANGDTAPFVGHNAVLRWSAIQEIAYTVPDERFIEKYWSEETVSEDFDMALRLQTKGYLVRLAAYQGDGFKEGVSLTVYDELHRWEKYAYGCNELIFHPVRYWIRRGPLTGVFIRFLTSGMPLPSKLTIIAYIGTYYAIGSAWVLTLGNYFLIGWFEGLLDHYYIDSYKVYFSIVCVFTALGNIALALLRHRLGENDFFHNLVVNLKWVPLLVLFLGGISFHVSQALLWHMFDLDMDWGATAKDMEVLSFFQEFPKVLRRFRISFLFCVLTAIGMIVCAYAVPTIWQIRGFTSVYPFSCVVVSHFLLPLVLNPNLMRFTW
ncbi:hypothetical protein BU23DRAFT_580744 [Bimuria novae-zelandiae CBS 107.79]|uniref:Uncharacterized protein n=1 Tax=Bimuria novae-zelandiae CBS 107.79 TaxID=1447943 RepID=A0A6A5VH51_9PLEO|nr:hypothetical protein BU23DRAFT_580744 [Bimuria novae-zelandiae CBS 107.79]